MTKYFFIILTSITFTTNYFANSKYNVIEVLPYGDTIGYNFVNEPLFYEESWDTLAQANFWKQIMQFDPDSCLINIAETRQILCKESYIKWQAQTEAEKETYKDSIRDLFCLKDSTRIYVTKGRSDFYDVRGVFKSIDKAVEVFEIMEVDPWYAQAILLIESPNKIQYSKVGAYGPFQLMKSVARKYGLRVDGVIDERKDFVKSAMGAARLLKKTAIPEAKKILVSQQLKYDENDLWFKLFVLHIYHAGSGNVHGVVKVIQPAQGGMELIRSMWQTEYGKFKNASQNYSQVALASYMLLDELIWHECEYIYQCNENNTEMGQFKAKPCIPEMNPIFFVKVDTEFLEPLTH
ncbi:MAG: transglycosylase SLT domain-containing protein [Flavobacteriales bacterium]|nr:transglycosylase SLT domain-containing protein [Flavobacteriales bacterium]